MTEDNNLPISTKWLVDSIGEVGRSLIDQIFMIYCPKTETKGTGFLYKSGHIITNWHVIENCSENEVIAISCKNERISFVEILIDKEKDLALLKPSIKINGGLDFDNSCEIKPGIKISTWGYPLGYNGPAPLLSIGYISGFKDHQEKKDSPIIKHIVVNGAFNPGNSGGPLFIAGSDKLIGVVVNKHLPIPLYLSSALEALAKNKSGLIFTRTDEKGNREDFAESQLVAELLDHLKKLTQVMIGEAIDMSEVLDFLKKNKVE